MDTSTVTAASRRSREAGVPQQALMLLLDRAQPLAGGARHSLANIDLVTIGRGQARAVQRLVEEGRPTLRISLPDARVSSLHARIERGSAGWLLRDCGSTNGSRVNRQSVQRALLEDGDVIEIGQTFFRYRGAVPMPFDAPGDVDTADLCALPKAFGTLLPQLVCDLETLTRISASDVSVLLLGDTGTGKEVVARAIHAESGRRGPFVAVNCGALPATLVESLLFGHTRGAFSGATQDAVGLVRTAQGGTLFLDEIGDLGASAQAAMLRVLQEREVTPLGATRPIPTDARVLSATHRPLVSLVGSGAFRQDLLARIRGFTFTLPELRARIDDVGLLVAALLGKIAGERAAHVSFSAEVVYAMLEHEWPENVRELEQRLKTGVVLAPGGRIELSHFWGDGDGPTRDPPRTTSASSPPSRRRSQEDEALHAELVLKLSEHRGNMTRVGEAMGKSRTQIQRWVRRLAIDVGRFR
jgi:sigma-54 dependent transcriptional regulator, acetoin dehydrogenase operon transcriptional activator AcoR